MAEPKSYAHLPEGRLPGPQTRRNYGVLRSGRLIKVLAIASIVGAIVLYGWGMKCAPSDESCAPIILLPIAGGLIVLALIFWVSGWLVDRKKRKRNAPNLQVALERDVFRLGETISPQVMVKNVSQVEGELEIGLICTCFYDYEYRTRTEHGTSTSRQTRSVAAFEEWRRIEKVGDQSVSFTLPDDAPYSHEGTAVSFAWKVTARERRKGIDRFTDLPFWVQTWA